MQVKEPIEGICDDRAVYALFSMFNGQDEAICEYSKDEILQKLNKMSFLKDNPKFKNDGMIGVI